jgi:hypothetical protein
MYRPQSLELKPTGAMGDASNVEPTEREISRLGSRGGCGSLKCAQDLLPQGIYIVARKRNPEPTVCD